MGDYGERGEREVGGLDRHNAGGIPGDILNKVFDPLSRAIIEKNMGGTSDGAELRIGA